MKKILLTFLLVFFGINLSAQEVYDEAFLKEMNKQLQQVHTAKNTVRFTAEGIATEKVLLPWYEFKKPVVNKEKHTILLQGWNKEIQISYSDKKNDVGKDFVEKLEKYSYHPMTDFRKDNFYPAPGKPDTVYLARNKAIEREFEDLGETITTYEIFHNKKDLFHFLNSQFEQTEEFTTGYSERNYEYEIQVNPAESAYYSKRAVSISDYNDFCLNRGKELPYFLQKKEAELSSPVPFSGKGNHLNQMDLAEYCSYLQEMWNVPVWFFTAEPERGYHRITLSEKEWKRKEFLDNLNGYMQKAYGEKSPVYFGYETIYSDEVKSVYWTEVENMLVNRNTREVVITTRSGREIRFGFTEEQYTHIASVQVNFLAFYKKIMHDE